MQYMVVETFKDYRGIYERFLANGRMLPDGLHYVSSWIGEDMSKCFQLMETEDIKLFDEWMANWDDLMDCEIIPVIMSSEAAKKAGM